MSGPVSTEMGDRAQFASYVERIFIFWCRILTILLLSNVLANRPKSTNKNRRTEQNARCSFRQIKSMQYERVQTTDVIGFESVEAFGSQEELFKRHLSLSVVFQCPRDNW